MPISYDGNQLCNIDGTQPADDELESTIAGWLRQTKLALLDWADQEHECTGKHRRWTGLTTGTSTAYELDLDMPSLDALFVGMVLYLKIHATNTGPATLSVTRTTPNLNHGVQNIRHPNGTALEAGELTINGTYPVVYNGSEWHLAVNGLIRVPKMNTGTFGDTILVAKWSGIAAGSYSMPIIDPVPDANGCFTITDVVTVEFVDGVIGGAYGA